MDQAEHMTQLVEALPSMRNICLVSEPKIPGRALHTQNVIIR